MPYLEKVVVRLKERYGEFLVGDRLDALADVSPVSLEEAVPAGFRVGLVMDLNHYGDRIQKVAHWYKYERFLIHNNIPYSIFSIHRSDWIEEAKRFSLVIFRPDVSPWALQEARTKIDFLEKKLHISCFPSSEEIWSYEDKIRLAYLYRQLRIPHVPTFISHSKEESLAYSQACRYPLVSKINTGSASRGVRLIRSPREARKFIRKVFAEGVPTYWPGHHQKDYVYFQPLIRHKGYDLRVIIVGDKAFGYYKLVKKGDFRASGSMFIQKSALPKQAIERAYRIKQQLKHTFLAVDFLEQQDTGEFLVLEASVFVDIYTASQAIVQGIPGYYLLRQHPFRMEFVPGKIWLQELVLLELMKQQIHARAVHGLVLDTGKSS
jgi:glutathione synthase/RimK-type ligase-like ATP-grasp enzyme